MGARARAERDLLARPRVRYLLWGVPQFCFLLGFFLATARPVLWPASLVVLGGLCLANARRCGRLHCYLTGPFYLGMAVIIAAYDLGVLPLGTRGWLWLGLTVVVVGNLLTFLPERRWGRYV